MWMFPKIGVGPQNGWFISWKTLLKWMIWGYHYFLKHPCSKDLIEFFTLFSSIHWMFFPALSIWFPFHFARFFVGNGIFKNPPLKYPRYLRSHLESIGNPAKKHFTEGPWCLFRSPGMFFFKDFGEMIRQKHLKNRSRKSFVPLNKTYFLHSLEMIISPPVGVCHVFNWFN